VYSDVLTQQSNIYAITIEKVKELEAAFAHNFPHFEVASRRYKAGYSTAAEKNWMYTTNLASLLVLVEHLSEFNRAGK
jgi:hypothetical protein